MKDNIYIYGAGEMGKKLLLHLLDTGYKVCGFIDRYKTGRINGIPIINKEQIHSNSNCCIVISIQDLYKCVEAYNFLSKIKVEKYWYLPSFTTSTAIDEICINITDWGENVLPRVDMHVSDSCNLNCVGCTHFSPLFDEVGCELDKCMGNIDLLLDKFSGIARLNLLGGEPLLNRNLAELIVSIRKKLPSTTIVLFTNGLLICKLSENLLRTIKENNIHVYISEYEPTHAIAGRIEECLRKYEISYLLSGYDHKQLFNKPLALNPTQNDKRLCISDGCISIADGHIAKCPTLLYVQKLNEKFGCQFPTDGIIDLNNCPMEGEALLEKLKEEVPLCDFCIENEIKWNICGRERKLSDFAKA